MLDAASFCSLTAPASPSFRAQPWRRTPLYPVNDNGQEDLERVCSHADSLVKLQSTVSMSSRSFVIVTSCSDGKRKHGQDSSLRLRHINGTPIDARFARWWQALQTANMAAMPARDLYIGDHFRISMQLPERLQQALPHCSAELFIASAGYGLLRADSPIHHYSATFLPRHQDSVTRCTGPQQAQDCITWWQLLTQNHLDDQTQPRSLVQLAQQDPSRYILVVASPSYVSAMQQDLRAAQHALRPAGSLLILSSPQDRLDPALRPALVCTNARLQALVSGPRQSLHARVARLLIDRISEHDFEPERARTLLEKLTNKTPPLQVYDRQPQTDPQIERFIKREMKHTKRPSASGLLRKLRQQGFQCEQMRFKLLYQRVNSEAT